VTRILLIPVAGTIAALVMIAYAREPRGEAKHPADTPLDFHGGSMHGAEDEEEPAAEEPVPEDEPLPGEPGEPTGEPEKPAPPPQEFQLRLEADGALVGEIVDPTRPEPVAFASAEDLIKRIGSARHTLVITNGAGVDRAKLDGIEALLRDRFTIRKVYRAEAPPSEER
jgi:hypothetical protein